MALPAGAIGQTGAAWLSRYVAKYGAALAQQRAERAELRRGNRGLDHPGLPIPRDDPPPYPPNTNRGGVLPGRDGGALITSSADRQAPVGALAQAAGPQPQPGQEAPAFAPLPLARVPEGPPIGKPDPTAAAPARRAPEGPPEPQRGATAAGPKLDFGELWEVTPKAEKDKQLAQLESQLGDIDKAYDDLAKRMGERPDTKLTREEKGGLLMEFGLSLMSYSAAQRHGQDLGAAVGDAGLDAVQTFKQLKAKKKADQETYDRTMGAIGTARVNAKGEAIKDEREGRKIESEITENEASATSSRAQASKYKADAEATVEKMKTGGLQDPHWVVFDDADGNSYAIDVANGGKKTKLGKNPEGGGKGERPYEFQVKYNMYLEANPDDVQGALNFANRTDGMSHGEKMKFALEQANKAQENGIIGSSQDEFEAYVDQTYGRLNDPGGKKNSASSSETDVTNEVPADVATRLVEGKEFTNAGGQVFVKRGGKIFYIGQAE